VKRQAEHDIRRKTKVLEHAKQSGNVSHTCRCYGISRDTYYRWKQQLETGGPEALINSKPCPKNLKIRIPNAINFLDYVIDKFPFRVKYVHTDNGHEFQSKFHWHAEDCGIVHRYIKPASPHLNGKVERSHLTGKQEFYQLLSYTGDQNLKRQLTDWETFYNYHQPHTALKGKTPYEILNMKLAA